jgi:hypothetical protein
LTFNELERLRDTSGLFALLTHYADLAATERQAWQDRQMQVPGCDARQVTRLHGELIAYGWLEQDTGSVPQPRAGAVPGCYRVTREGLRALKQVRVGEVD